MPKTFSEVYKVKSPDEQKFIDKHVVIKHADRNGNGDDLFNAKKTKTVKRYKEGHGYESGQDAKVYEGFEGHGLLVKAAHAKVKSGHAEDIHTALSQVINSKYATSPVEYRKKLHSVTLAAIKKHNNPVKEDLETIENTLLEYLDELGEEISYEELQELALGLQEELLDELSGSTLGRYVAKSTSDEKKRKSDGKAWAQEIRAKTGLNVGAPIDRKLYSPVASRKAGYTRAIAKLTGNAKVNVKEEVLDELSKQALGSYIRVAAANKGNAAFATGVLSAKTHSKQLDTAQKKEYKRTKGIGKALDRLTNNRYSFKEGVNKLTKENLDNIINRYHQEEISLEEALMAKIAHLSESNQALILTLFDTLSEDNQETLFETVDDEDGINETIDFALDAQLKEVASYEVEGEHKEEGHIKTRSYFAKSSSDAKSQFHMKHSKDEYKINKVKKLAEESLDELSKETLKSYNKKALRSANKSWEKSSEEEDKAMSTDGEKYPDKQARHQKNAYNHEIKYFKRTKGIERASQRLIGMMKAKK